MGDLQEPQRAPLAGSEASVAPDAPPQPSMVREGVVLVEIALVATLFLGMVAALYYFSWWRISRDGPQPTATYICEGDEAFDGATVAIMDVEVVAQGRLTAENNHTFATRLTPGKYTVILKHQGEQTELERSIRLRDYDYRHISLRRKPDSPATGPS